LRGSGEKRPSFQARKEDRAERKADKLLREMVERGERATKKDTLFRDNTKSLREAQSLLDLGISKKQSSDWQKLEPLAERHRRGG
jgi:hypothetical protein